MVLINKIDEKYCTQGKFRHCYILALFTIVALGSKFEFITGQIDEKGLCNKLKSGRVKD